LYKYRFKVLFTQSDIEIIVATMQRRNLDFLKGMFPHHAIDELQILVVNQTDFEPITSGIPNVRVINTPEKGLSKSRNLGLEQAKGKLCLLTDDDVVYEKDFLDTVVKGFSLHKNAAAIKFRAKGLDGSYFKKYSNNPKSRLTDLDLLAIMSIELVYNIPLIKNHGKRFNTHFGLGTDFPLGEEQLFLKELKETGLSVAYYPEPIVSHLDQKNSDNIPFSVYWKTIGAFYCVMFRKTKYIWLLISLFFKMKHRGLSINKVLPAISYFRKGSKQYQDLKTSNDEC